MDMYNVNMNNELIFTFIKRINQNIKNGHQQRVDCEINVRKCFRV